MAEQIILIGAGGAEFPFDLPLPPHIQDKLDRGEMTEKTVDSPSPEDETPRKKPTRKES